MLKQHCEICDGIIPAVESYKTVHFGRGNNPNINVGFDPMVICKKCWKKMLEAVKPEMVQSEEEMIERSSAKTAEKRQQRADALENEITNFLVSMSPDNLLKGKDKACENCKFGGLALSDEPCKSCTGKDKWVNDNEG